MSDDKNVWRGPYMPPTETEPVTLRTADDRRDELLAVAATLLGGVQQNVLNGMIRQAGTEIEIKITPAAKSYATAAVMLAWHLIETVDATTTTEGDQ